MLQPVEALKFLLSNCFSIIGAIGAIIFLVVGTMMFLASIGGGSFPPRRPKYRVPDALVKFGPQFLPRAPHELDIAIQQMDDNK